MGAVTAPDLFARTKRVVIKIGSALLVNAETGELREDWLRALAEDIVKLKAEGREVLVVSSGSIALGRRVLGLPSGALPLEQSQAAAAVGQIRLARAYDGVLGPHGITTAQVLVTLEDSENRRRYLNSRATLETLLTLGCVPIVNENDTVATDEIRYGDNDRLAAQVSVLAGADLLVLLSDVDGLYTRDPRLGDAGHIDLVDSITPEIEAMAGSSMNASAKGGMKTKVWAARTATASGCAVVVTLGDQTRPISALRAGSRSTVFAAKTDPAAARKRWIDAMKPKGRILIDAGAVAALGRGKSLLPAGVKSVEGQFERGDPVDIVDGAGHHVARALISYRAEDARAIAGAQSSEIAGILGHDGRAALVHRDDMAM